MAKNRPLARKLASFTPRPLTTQHVIDYWLLIGLDRVEIGREWKEADYNVICVREANLLLISDWMREIT